MNERRPRNTQQTPDLPGFGIFGTPKTLRLEVSTRIFNALTISNKTGRESIFNALKIFDHEGFANAKQRRATDAAR